MKNTHEKPLARLHAHLGTRRTVMLVIGLSCVFRGLTLLHDTGTQFSGQSIIYLDIPLPVRIAGWVGTGLAAVGGAFFARASNEWLGWTALWIMPAERVFGYLWAFFDWLLPFGGAGSPYGIFYAGQWLCAVTLLAVVATWREDTPSRLRKSREGG